VDDFEGLAAIVVAEVFDILQNESGVTLFP